MPAERSPRPHKLRHIPVRLRVSVDPEAWGLKGRELEDAVREEVVTRVRQHPDVIDARRDRL